MLRAAERHCHSMRALPRQNPGHAAYRSPAMRRPFGGHLETAQAKMREEMPRVSLRARKGSFREVDEGFKEPLPFGNQTLLQCHREL